MATSRFDQVAKAFAADGTRRRVLHLLASLPFVAGLVTFFGEELADAAGRRKRRKKRHKHGRPRPRHRHKNKKQPCQPQSPAQSCAGTCGKVENNCQKAVDCGSCACEPACAECFTCQEPPGQPGFCVPANAGEACGQPGQVCQADGSCTCTSTSCGAGQICCGGECRTCPAPANGVATCVGSVCGVGCDAGFHACGSCCAANDSSQTCGDRCAPCPPGEDCDGTACTCGGGPSCGDGGVCCGGECCPAGRLCDGSGGCVAPSGCCSGDATCGAYTSVGWLCCVTPRIAACCCESEPGAGDGFVRCCEPDDEECLGSCTRFARGGPASADCTDPGGFATTSCATCGAG